MTTATAPTLAELFPADRYEISGGVAILDEYTRADGTRITKDDLQAVVNANNLAIEDTGDYVPLTLGHTPDDDEKAQPPVVGFAGPFKLAQLGKVNPRWAIIAENWIVDKLHSDEVKKHPRRSVELWFDGETKKPTRIDPIALLGATAPRRTLGLKLSAKGDRTAYRECYEMGGEKKPPKGDNQGSANAGDGKTPNQPQNPVPPSGDDALVAKILAAIEQTDWLVFLRGKMAEDAAAAAAENQNLAQQIPANNDPNAQAQDGMADNAGDDDMSGTNTNANQTIPGGNGDDKTKEKFQATAGEVDKLKAENGEFKDKLAAMSTRIEQLEKDKLKAERECKLRDMLDQGIQFDLADAKKEVDKMSADEFTRHCATIEKYAQRVPIGHELPPAEVDKLRNSPKGADHKAIVERAKEIAASDTASGDGVEKMKRAMKAAEAEFKSKA